MSRPVFTAEALAATPAGRLPSNAAVLGIAAQVGKKARRVTVAKSVSLPPSTYDAEAGVAVIVLPQPTKSLHPNSRPSRRQKISDTAKTREQAKYATVGLLRSTRPMWAGADVFLTVYLTTRRNADGLNCVTWCKAVEDGIADAGLVANDSGNVWHPVTILADRCCPRIELRFVRRAG